MNNKRNILKGIFFILMSALGFALMNFFVKMAGDLPSFQKAFFRNAIATLVALLAVIKSKKSIQKVRGSIWLLILRSALGTIGIVLNFYAVETLALSDASMIQKLSPFVVIILSLIFLKEKVESYQWIAVITAFVGALFIIKPSLSGVSIGSLQAVVGAIMAGAAYTCVRGLSIRGIRGEFIIFFFSAFSCVSLIPFVIVGFVPMTGVQVLYLILVGLCATMGQFGITFAYSYARASQVSVFEYTQTLFAGLLGFFFLSQVPDSYSIVGYFIITSVGIFMIIRGARHKDEKSNNN